MIDVQLPDGRKISVQTDDPQEAARAGRRLLAREAILKSGMGGGKKETALGQAANDATNGATLGLAHVMDGGINAGITGVQNLLMRARGKTPTYGAADAYAADRGLLKERQADHPVASGAGGLLGAFAMPGSEQLAGFAAKGLPKVAAAAEGVPVVGGLLKGLLSSTRAPAVALRSAGAGVPVGAVAGAANANPGEELQGAGTGATVGGLTGAALPVAAGAVGKLGQGARSVGSAVVRSVNKATGGSMLDAAKTAGQRLTAALKSDGASPAELRSIQNEWLKTGASSPTLMDLATKLPSGGQNTMRLLTGAASKGRGAGIATNHAEDVAAALPDNVMSRARAMTPDARPANAVADELKATQGVLAGEQYAEPYATPVSVTPDIAGALRDEPGQAAVRRAIKGAVARQDYDAAGRLHSLLGLDVPEIPQMSPQAMERVRAASLASTPDVTAGDLDRVRIAMNERGEGAMRGTTPARDVAGGLFGRGKQIDAALDTVPEIQPARQTYRGMQAKRDALDEGSGALTAMPDDYEASMRDFIAKATPADNPHPVSEDDIRGAAAIGHRQAITDAVGAPAAGGTGFMSKLVRSPNQIRNADTSFGPDEAGGFRDAVQNELEKLRNARQVDPLGGSPTARRIDAAQGADDISLPARPTLGGAVLGLINKVRQGATLSDTEREAVVHLGLSTPDPAQLDQFEPDPQKLLELLHRSGALASMPIAQFAAENSQ